MSAAAAPLNGRSRFTHETGPMPDDEQPQGVSGAELLRMVRESVEQGIRRAAVTAAPPPVEVVDMKDKALMVLSVVALAAVVGLSVALAFTLWGP